MDHERIPDTFKYNMNDTIVDPHIFQTQIPVAKRAVVGGFRKSAHHAAVGSEHREREGVQYSEPLCGSPVKVAIYSIPSSYH